MSRLYWNRETKGMGISGTKGCTMFENDATRRKRLKNMKKRGIKKKYQGANPKQPTGDISTPNSANAHD